LREISLKNQDQEGLCSYEPSPESDIASSAAKTDEPPPELEKELGLAEGLVAQKKFSAAEEVLGKLQQKFFHGLKQEKRKELTASPRFRLLLASSQLLKARIREQQGDLEGARGIYGKVLPVLDDAVSKGKGKEIAVQALLLRAQAHGGLQNYLEAMGDYQAAREADPKHEGEAKAYREQLEKLTSLFSEERQKGEFEKNIPRVIYFLTEEVKLQEALGHEETFQELSKKLSELNRQYGVDTMVKEAQEIAAAGHLPLEKIKEVIRPYFVFSQTSKGAIELQFTDAFYALEDKKKLEIFQEISQVGRLEALRESSKKESDPIKRLYFQGQVDLLEGNLAKAQVEMMDFLSKTKGSPSPQPPSTLLRTGSPVEGEGKISEYREQIRPMLKQMSLMAVGQLEQQNEALFAQRMNNPEMMFSAERVYQSNRTYLTYLKRALETGNADTLDEAKEVYAQVHHAMQKKFEVDGVVGEILKVELKYKPPQGYTEYEKEKKAEKAMLQAYYKDGKDLQLFDPNSFSGSASVRLEGGSLKFPPRSLAHSFPNVLPGDCR
jgi:tetratricopeptide (TPR) repeat protein